MLPTGMNRIWLVAAGVALLVIGLLILWFIPQEETVTPEPAATEEEEVAFERQRVLGQSVEGRDIVAYHFGTGEHELVFVGGLHGGYEWNSSLLAYEMMAHVRENQAFVPDDLMLTIIPNANPDAMALVTGKDGAFTATDVNTAAANGTARFNANNVDLNRNFACNWAPESSWRNETVSAGSAPFSEPEVDALSDYLFARKPEAVVFWHSQASAVYASECNEGVLPETTVVMNTYATAAGYRAVESFDAYPITGDAEGWLASIGVPAVTVELSSHDSIEWQKNLAGTEALLQYYATAVAK